MAGELICWNIFELSPTTHPIVGVMYRGRFRKSAIEAGYNFLVDNALDKKGLVRVAAMEGEEGVLQKIQEVSDRVVPGVQITKVLEKVPNPILAKLHQNDVTIYADIKATLIVSEQDFALLELRKKKLDVRKMDAETAIIEIGDTVAFVMKEDASQSQRRIIRDIKTTKTKEELLSLIKDMNISLDGLSISDSGEMIIFCFA